MSKMSNSNPAELPTKYAAAFRQAIVYKKINIFNCNYSNVMKRDPSREELNR